MQKKMTPHHPDLTLPLLVFVLALVTHWSFAIRLSLVQPTASSVSDERPVNWPPQWLKGCNSKDIVKNSTFGRYCQKVSESLKMSQAIDVLLVAAKSYSSLSDKMEADDAALDLEEVTSEGVKSTDNGEELSLFQRKFLGLDDEVYETIIETDDRNQAIMIADYDETEEGKTKSKRYMMEISGTDPNRLHSMRESCTIYAQTIMIHIPRCVPKMTVITRCMGTCHSHAHPDFDPVSGQVRIIEHCTCCKPLRLRTRSLTFQCPGFPGGTLTRNMSYPFDCTCRPCASVPQFIST